MVAMTAQDLLMAGLEGLGSWGASRVATIAVGTEHSWSARPRISLLQMVTYLSQLKCLNDICAAIVKRLTDAETR